MARIRSIKPEFCTSEQVADCSPTARLLFILMWPFCDDRGVHPDSAKRLKMQCFPADDFTAADIEALISELVAHGLLRRFQVDEQRYLHVTGWEKHQKIEKPNYKWPAPPTNGGLVSTDDRQSIGEPAPVVADLSENGRRVVGDSSPPEWSGEERSREEEKAAPRERWRDVGPTVCDMLGKPEWTYGIVRQWIADGADPEGDILPCIREAIGDGRASKARSLNYFTPAITQRRDERMAADRLEAKRTEDPARAEWRQRLNRFRDAGFWIDVWGAKPDQKPRVGEAPCGAPADLIAEILQPVAA